MTKISNEYPQPNIELLRGSDANLIFCQGKSNAQLCPLAMKYQSCVIAERSLPKKQKVHCFKITMSLMGERNKMLLSFVQ